MKRYRRLRRLQPDGELLRRRASGEPLRQLAVDYGVSHSSLCRYFARPAVASELKRTERLLRAEAKAAWARQRREPQSAEQTDQQRQAQPAAGASEREHKSRDRAPNVELSDEQLLKAVETDRRVARAVIDGHESDLRHRCQEELRARRPEHARRLAAELRDWVETRLGSEWTHARWIDARRVRTLKSDLDVIEYFTREYNPPPSAASSGAARARPAAYSQTRLLAACFDSKLLTGTPPGRS